MDYLIDIKCQMKSVFWLGCQTMALDIFVDLPSSFLNFR